MEGDSKYCSIYGSGFISIHSLRMEGDGIRRVSTALQQDFNPLPPHGGRQPAWFRSSQISVFQSTPSAWRETGQALGRPGVPGISIHSLRMEGDRRKEHNMAKTNLFQSTPSAWRETSTSGAVMATSVRFQSTPSAWRETGCLVGKIRVLRISIHSLRMEGDCAGVLVSARTGNFNPLPPHGGRPGESGHGDGDRGISIHSLRMEGDGWGGFWGMGITFQSTPSAWRETQDSTPLPTLSGISIHSLRMEGDPAKGQPIQPIRLFQSTPSAWRETYVLREWLFCINISIHSLRMEGDQQGAVCLLHCLVISIHSLRMEGDRRTHLAVSWLCHFNPLPPHGGRR